MTELFTGYVGAMLAEAARAPAANWKAKDCAIYLVAALTVRCAMPCYTMLCYAALC